VALLEEAVFGWRRHRGFCDVCRLDRRTGQDRYVWAKNRIFIKVPHEVFKFTTAAEDVGGRDSWRAASCSHFHKKTPKPMSLSKGMRLGPYTILAPLGVGGMGEVYRARDSKLNRDVALKVLPELFARDAERMARFQREAQVLASLNHPNIASIYGLEESSGVRALVMELVEGPTLADRIAQGAIPLDEALPMVQQMAEALEYAHEKGIIHRDLKPANVKTTPEGPVKVLDFGLAKALETPLASSPSLSGPGEGQNSPTLTLAASQAGVILGTAAYMAPEQARGKTVDRRADIWSFGVVFYEMLTGKRLYGGETISDTLAAVLKVEPDWDALPADAPLGIRRLLRRCLTKDRRERLQAMGDARIEIEECLSAPAAAQGTEPKLLTTGRRREQLAWALAVVLPIAAIAGTVSYLRLARAPAHTIIAEIPPPEKTQFNFAGVSGGPPVLSPDGRTVAFSASDVSGKTMLWARTLDSTFARLLPGTEGAIDPFWSGDSRALGFFAEGKLKTIEASGGPALVVADAPRPVGGSWNREGTLLFAPDFRKGLYTVAASGGTPVPVLKVDASKYSSYIRPKFLPDGKHFLYRAGASDPRSSGINFASLDGTQNQPLLKGVGSATYASGFLLYLRDTTLMAQAFDPERGQLKGDAHPVAEQIVGDFGRGFFDASENGVLTYQMGGSPGERRLTWFDRAGRDSGVTGEVATYYDVRLSPDGRKLAFNAGDPNSEIWVDDLARDVGMRLTVDPGTDHGVPVWSPDGSRILFGAFQGKARSGIYQKASNGAGGEELLLPAETSDPQVCPTSWSRDGKFILYSRGDVYDLTHAEIWVLPLAGDRKPRPLVQTPVAAYDGEFSPNARWVAYTSKESGRAEVYIVPFEAAKVFNTSSGSGASLGDKWQVSPGGGRCPRWRRDGKEIFYLAPDNQMMAAQVEERGSSIEVRTAQPIFRAAVATDPFSPYDVTADGKRFVITTLSNTNTSLTLVVNWTARLGTKP
jgi:eukaryotic-like serine/threonine-protein kinase